MLEVNKINVSYGISQALWDVSLKVKEGETVVVVGPNGTGKTTVLKTISGLFHPTSGEIKFLGKRIDKLPPWQITEIGLIQVPERRLLFPYMSVFEHLELGAHKRKDRIEENLKVVYDLFPVLKERKQQKAGTLSGGEGKMLAIARGLMAEPKLLMLDEPSLGLAPKLIVDIFQLIEQLCERGLTLLLVEQNARMALRLADRAYLLENGRVTLQGTGEEFLKNPHLEEAYLGL